MLLQTVKRQLSRLMFLGMFYGNIWKYPVNLHHLDESLLICSVERTVRAIEFDRKNERTSLETKTYSYERATRHD